MSSISIVRMSIDLNLIRTFLSIYDNRSVTRAAKELSLSQPTVSYALGRLRRALEDPLFVRGAGGLEPTVRARELASAFRPAVASIDDAVGTGRVFDPSTTTRSFRLCLSDIGEQTFLPKIMTQLLRQAPQASLEVAPMQIAEVPGWLARGELDAAIASTALEVSGRHRIFGERYVCVLPADTAPAGPRLPREDFLAYRHVAIDPAAGHSQAESALAERLIGRRIALRVPHFSALPELIVGCGMAAVLPWQMASLMTRHWPIAIRELPVEVDPFDVTLYWDRGVAATGATAWFISLVVTALEIPSTPDASRGAE